MRIFQSWRELMADIMKLTEQELKDAINLEVSTYRRKRFIERMHMRFERLRSERERAELVAGETLL